MSVKIYRSGNIIYIEDVATGSMRSDRAIDVEIRRTTTSSTRFNIHSDDFGNKTYDVSEIQDIDGNEYADADTFERWADKNTGATFFKEETDQATLSEVTVTKTVSVKLLDANEDRIGAIFSNIGTQDVLIKFKAAGGATIEGFLLKSEETHSLSEIEARYKGEISAIRATTIGTLTSIVRITEF